MHPRDRCSRPSGTRLPADRRARRAADRRVDLATLVKDDDALAKHIRENVAGTFHPVGTCRMDQANDRDAVVDTAGRVRGIAGLRVIGASIMPARHLLRHS
jgi:choline dehydrogenase-like flavoprotein